ncbi:glycosyltransferase [Bacteroides stercorirosoris]|uniref:glycosyltransferase n=1 Tax=Bacteroides stercorirosoris TaxID=871324 RepID=UPI00046FCA3D|nr:glycosyltransferase family 4 protein [Bacteroides stercorirosoris]
MDKTARLLYDLDKRKLVLKVICNERLECDCDNLIIENICWSRQGAIEGMLKAHIGIMPLLDSEFTRGKGGFKLIQYLSIGLPCIGSDVGYNHSIISLECGFLPRTESEWITAIIKLSNILSWKSYSENAFQYWRLNFSYEKNLEVWKALINEP